MNDEGKEMVEKKWEGGERLEVQRWREGGL